MLELVRSLVEAAGTFMQHQTSLGHFEFLGLDIIADDAGGVWLMEGEMFSALVHSPLCSTRGLLVITDAWCLIPYT